MESTFWRISDLAEQQHGAVAVWQMRDQLGLSPGQIRAAVRQLVRVHHGVYAIGDIGELGWYAAAAFALGAEGVVSHQSALMLLGLRPHQPHEIHVSVPGNGGRRRREARLLHEPSPR